MDPELQNLITWKQASKLGGKVAKVAGTKVLTGGLFQNLDQEPELENLITWKQAG